MPDPSSSAAALTRDELRAELERCFASFAMKADYAHFRCELQSEIASLRAELIKWMPGLMLVSVTAAVGIAVPVDRLLG